MVFAGDTFGVQRWWPVKFLQSCRPWRWNINTLHRITQVSTSLLVLYISTFRTKIMWTESSLMVKTSTRIRLIVVLLYKGQMLLFHFDLLLTFLLWNVICMWLVMFSFSMTINSYLNKTDITYSRLPAWKSKDKSKERRALFSFRYVTPLNIVV